MRHVTLRRVVVLVVLLVCGIFPALATAGSLVREGSGADAASITAVVDQFRTDLGTLNPNTPVTLPNGRREINWDGVPDGFASPNAFPGNFFNGTTPGRARGIEFNGAGTFQVSASASNPTSTPVRFGNLDPAHSTRFSVFSAERLFGTLDSTVFDVRFFLPGTTTPAAVSGFGAVFTDVDSATSTRLDFFDASNNLLLSRNVLPGTTPEGSLSFLGISFNAGEDITRVRITAGDKALNGGGTEAAGDFVAMDDFIFGEPRALATSAIPLPSAWLMALSVLGPLAVVTQVAKRRRVA